MIKNGNVFSVGRGATLSTTTHCSWIRFPPFYYDMKMALMHYKLWYYMTLASIMITKKIRKGSIELLGRNVSVRRIQKDKFFVVYGLL